MSKKIAIIGSTGSIGTSTIEVVRNLGQENVQIVALAAGSNIELLEEQAREFHPELIAVYDEQKAAELKRRLPNMTVIPGLEGIRAAASITSSNLVISSMVGTLGLIPTVEAIRSKKDVALANKEALVSGGALVMKLSKDHGVNILPIDSEHSAIFQCLQGNDKASVSRIVLTSSGGPFRNYSLTQLESINVEDALNHPTWQMGPKVTIDSSTLMNKGLEVIEARWLFDMPIENIDVVIHPQSIIHSMVEYMDGSMLAQMSRPTMLVPIQYAITHPNRSKGLIEPFDFIKHNTIEFYQPDVEKFRCLQLAFDSIQEGKSMPCYMNAANEVLVDRFLQKQISWKDISTKLDGLMSSHNKQPVDEIDDILNIDAIGRAEASNA
ncbi:MAG: 1-deoxy-D-xylulose-5-phosphate reductoisomerase [Chlamydiota bacterium]